MGNKHTPEIRFPGFPGDWEQRNVRDFSEKTFGGGTPKTSIKEYWNGEIPWIQSSDLHEHQVLDVFIKKKITEKGLKNSATKLIPKNSIAVVTRVGVGKIALIQFEYTTSQDYLSLSNLKVNEWFGVYSLYNRLQKELNNVQGTSIKGITKNELLDKKINTPTDKVEQIKIGNFFKQLDDTIALHQQELDTLKQTKQGFLQKMFPKEGESVPEIRFPGFNGEWKQRKLKEFGKATGGTSIESEFVDKGKYKVINIGSYSENSIYTDQGIRAMGTEKTKQRILNKGDLTMILNDKTSTGRIIGRVLLIDEDNSYVYNQRTERIEPDKNNFDSQFLYQLLNADSIRSKIVRSAQGNTQIYVNWSSISELTYLVPNKNEQTQIGNFFKQLDDTIALHEKELETLKQTKKAFLQKMFV